MAGTEALIARNDWRGPRPTTTSSLPEQIPCVIRNVQSGTMLARTGTPAVAVCDKRNPADSRQDWVIRDSQAGYVRILSPDGTLALTQSGVDAQCTLTDANVATDAQSWKRTGDGTRDLFVNKERASLRLNLSGGSPNPATPVLAWAGGQGSNGLWIIERPLPANTYYLRNDRGGTVLDVGTSGTVGNPVAPASTTQLWLLAPGQAGYWTISHNSGAGWQALTQNGANAQCTLAAPTNSDQQNWIFEADGAAWQLWTIRSKQNPDLVLDLSGGSSKAATPVFAYADKGGTNQKWKLQSTLPAADVYQVVNLAAGTLLDLDRQDQPPTTAANPYAPAGEPTATQFWRLVAGQLGYWQFQNLRNDLAATQNGTDQPCRLQPLDTASNQQNWFILSEGGPPATQWVVSNKENKDLVLDLADGRKNANTPVLAYTENGGDNQKWILHGQKSAGLVPQWTLRMIMRDLLGATRPHTYLNDASYAPVARTDTTTIWNGTRLSPTSARRIPLTAGVFEAQDFADVMKAAVARWCYHRLPVPPPQVGQACLFGTLITVEQATNIRNAYNFSIGDLWQVYLFDPQTGHVHLSVPAHQRAVIAYA